MKYLLQQKWVSNHQFLFFESRESVETSYRALAVDDRDEFAHSQITVVSCAHKFAEVKAEIHFELLNCLSKGKVRKA